MDLFQKLIISFIKSKNTFLAILIILFASYFVMAFFPASEIINNIFNITLVSMSCITALFLIFSVFAIYKIENKFYISWLFIGFAYLSFAIGDVLSHIIEIHIATQPLSILVNIFYVLFYPLFFIGISNLPFASMNQKQKVNLLLEISVIVLSTGFILWNFLVRPFFAGEKIGAGITILLVSAPVCDTALLWFVSKVLFKKKSPLLGKSYKFLYLGIFILLLSDLGFLYMIIVEKKFWSLFVFLGYPLSQGLIILSCIEFIYTSLSLKGIEDEPMSKESYSLASIIIAYSSFFIAYLTVFTNKKDNFELIFIPAVILLGLIRQIMSILENKRLFRDLQKSHNFLEDQVAIKTIELAQSYDETLYILSKSFELRDKETQGHTIRLAELTVELSKIMGIEEKNFIHIKRGALLHDIGKMGIPDNILLKPGPLNENEWEIMKKHPVIAKDLIEKVKFLKPALTIPYFHHERWNGKGYPEGLKEEMIPIEARIFSVLDVWDALTNNRPYRNAWTQDRAIEYIKENSGILFDKKVVINFLFLIEKNSKIFLH